MIDRTLNMYRPSPGLRWRLVRALTRDLQGCYRLYDHCNVVPYFGMRRIKHSERRYGYRCCIKYCSLWTLSLFCCILVHLLLVTDMTDSFLKRAGEKYVYEHENKSRVAYGKLTSSATQHSCTKTWSFIRYHELYKNRFQITVRCMFNTLMNLLCIFIAFISSMFIILWSNNVVAIACLFVRNLLQSIWPIIYCSEMKVKCNEMKYSINLLSAVLLTLLSLNVIITWCLPPLTAVMLP